MASVKTIGLEEAAALLKLHPQTIRRKSREGTLPGYKSGHDWIFIEEDLIAWLRSTRQPEKPPIELPSFAKSSRPYRISDSILRRQQDVEAELDALLAPKRKGRRLNSGK